MSNQSSQWIQKFFNPVDYFFSWTSDWYQWDSIQARKEALKRRNEYAKELKKQGYEVHKTSLSGQLIRRGGIGTHFPDVEFIVNCPGLNAFPRTKEA